MRVSNKILRFVVALVSVSGMLVVPALSADDDHACCPAANIAAASHQMVVQAPADPQHMSHMHSHADTSDDDNLSEVDCDPANCTTTASAQLLLAYGQQTKAHGAGGKIFLPFSEIASSAQYKLVTPPPRLS